MHGDRRGREEKKEHEKTLVARYIHYFDCSDNFIHTSKCKLYILNMYSVLHVNYMPTKIIKFRKIYFIVDNDS